VFADIRVKLGHTLRNMNNSDFLSLPKKFAVRFSKFTSCMLNLAISAQRAPEENRNSTTTRFLSDHLSAAGFTQAFSCSLR